MFRICSVFLAACIATCSVAGALERPDVEFKIFQFPHDMMPRIDGQTGDWDVVSDNYLILFPGRMAPPSCPKSGMLP